MGEVEEKRLVLVCLNELAGLLPQPISQILALLLGDEVRVIVGAVIAASAGAAPMFTGNVHIKTLGRRVCAQMPFAHRGGHIPS